MQAVAAAARYLLRLPIRLLFRAFRRTIVRTQYEYISGLDKDAQITFLNYGYASRDPEAPPIELDPEEERDRYGIQLYHRVAGAIDLAGLDVLEVGCGRGGGAAHVIQRFHPRSLTALDFCKSAIEFCACHYEIDGLQFVRGDAEHLEFEDASFDAVLNIESSHCYGRIDRFFREVARVLRPGGYFLFADFRKEERLDLLRGQLAEAGLAVLREDDITPEVVNALDLDRDRRLKLIEKRVPERRREAFKTFAGIEGTFVYDGMKSGAVRYMAFVLQKPAG
ncbi:MAG: class I SAM-dependent methyltransferase [Candidatus Hydrogenedentes bacterium]|nr:class I SAM-dependent methyltransferase [Candidatus Hydrogenedentota bacterium]